MDLQTVRLAVIFGNDANFASGRGAKDAAVGDVNAVEVAITVEGRTFEESGDRYAGMLLARPRRQISSLLSTQIIGKADTHISLNHLWRIEVIHVENPFPRCS